MRNKPKVTLSPCLFALKWPDTEQPSNRRVFKHSGKAFKHKAKFKDNHQIQVVSLLDYDQVWQGIDHACSELKKDIDYQATKASHTILQAQIWAQEARTQQSIVKDRDAEIERLKRGLEFYASGNHLYGGVAGLIEAGFDTVSGEPGNWWFPDEDESGQIGVEDGTVAKLVLQGHSIPGDH